MTPFGLAPGNCEPVSWHGTASGEVVNVDCFSPSRHFQNREFSVAYARGTNLMG